jgi:hypothetical protein
MTARRAPLTRIARHVEHEGQVRTALAVRRGKVPVAIERLPRAALIAAACVAYGPGHRLRIARRPA